MISFADNFEHLSPIRKHLGIPNIRDLWLRSTSCYTHKIIHKHGHAHESIYFEKVMNSNRITRITSSNNVLRSKQIKTSFGKNSFDFNAVKSWNFLPLSVKMVEDKNHFKSLIKTVNWDDLRL